MLKKLMVILLAVLMTLPALAEETLLEMHAAQLTRDMAQLATDDAYLAMYTGGYFLSGSEKLTRLAACTWCEPVCDVYLSVDEAMMGDMLAAMGGTLQAEYVLPFIVFAVDPPVDQDALLIRNLAQISVTYIDEAQPDGMMVFVRFYADGLPVLFCLNAQGSAVMLTATPITNVPELPVGEEAQTLQASFNESGMPLYASEMPQMLLTGSGHVLSGDTMTQRAVSLAQEAGRRMSDPVHRMMFGLTPAQEQLMAEWGNGEFGAPSMILALQLDPRVHGVSVWGMDAVEVLADADSPAARRLAGMVNGSYFGALIARRGVDMHVAANATTTSTFYADPSQPDGSGAYLLFYEGGRLMLVSWIAENGVVDMGAEYLPIPGLSECTDATEAELWFVQNATPVDLTQVIPEY